MQRQHMRLAAAILTVLLAAPAHADDSGDIRARLEQWAEDFNASRAEAACDLFSKELVSTVRGQGDADYRTRCDLITRALADPARDYRYQLDLKEIIVEGNLAVARVEWTLHIAPLDVTSIESGLDVFRREPDGRWRIVRFMSYEAE